MKPVAWRCKRCGEQLVYYNIGFDSGYQCPRCKSILEYHELKRDAVPDPKLREKFDER